jgi:type VI secretion system protein VasD
MRTRRSLLWLLLGTAFLFLFTACPKEPARVAVTLNAAPNVNPDPSGKPLSVVVRVYQLKDKGRLESAEYNAIWKMDKETLSDDFLAVQERVLKPGTSEVLEIQANPMAKYVGVVALFRNTSGDTWRRLVPVAGKKQSIKLAVRDQAIELESVGK